MAQAQVKILQAPEFYDTEYLNSLLDESGLTVQSLAVHAGHSPVTITEALRGEGKKFKPVWDMINVLNGDWETLFRSKSKKRKSSSRGTFGGTTRQCRRLEGPVIAGGTRWPVKVAASRNGSVPQFSVASR